MKIGIARAEIAARQASIERPRLTRDLIDYPTSRAGQALDTAPVDESQCRLKGSSEEVVHLIQRLSGNRLLLTKLLAEVLEDEFY